MNIKGLLPLLGVIVFLACVKEPPPPDISTVVMPPLTHQGINSFGCHVDGELFVANKGPSVWSYAPLSGSFNESTKLLLLEGTQHRANSEINEGILIRAYITSGTSTYNYAYNPDAENYGYTHNMAPPKCEYYYQDYPGFDVGKLTITHLDEAKRIISGTFYMNLINKACEEDDTLMRITDGRLDFSY